MQMRRVAGGHPLRHHRSKRAQHQVDGALHLAEAGEARAREVGIEDRALGRDDIDRPRHALVLRHVDRVGHGIEEDHPRDERHGGAGRALEGHVEAGWYLVAGAGEVVGDLVALDDHLDLDRQFAASVDPVVVQIADPRLVFAVGDLGDFPPEHLLGIGHPVLAGLLDDAQPIALDQVEVAPLGELAGRDHRLDVALVGRRRAHVLQDVAPEPVLPHAFHRELHGTVDVAFGVDIDRVDVDPRIGAADVEQVGGRAREPHNFVPVVDRHDDRAVGRVGGAIIRVVVEDDVAFVDVPVEQLDDVLHDARHRAHEHRRRFRFRQHEAVAIEDAGAEIFGFADDRRIGHAVEHARHLLSDGGKRAADDALHDRRCEIVPVLRHRVRAVDHDIAASVDGRLAAGRDHHGRIVLLDDGGARDPVARAERSAVVERGLVSLALALDLEDDRLAQQRRRLAAAAFDLRPVEVRDAADAHRPDVDDLDRCIEAVAVFGFVRAVEAVGQFFDPGVVDLACRRVEADLVALAGVAAVGKAADQAVALGHAVGLQPCERLRRQLFEARREMGTVEGRERLALGGHELVLHVGRQQPGGRENAGMRRHQDPRDFELHRDVAGEERAGTAGGDEREVARVVAAPHAVELDGLHHAELLDLQRAERGLLQRHVERAGETLDGP